MENLCKRTDMADKNILVGFASLFIAPILVGLLFRSTVATQIGLIFSGLIMLFVSPIILINAFRDNKKLFALCISFTIGIAFYEFGVASVLNQLQNRGWGYVLTTPLLVVLAGILYCWLMYFLISTLRILFIKTKK
jgi:hypothetical protein